MSRTQADADRDGFVVTDRVRVRRDGSVLVRLLRGPARRRVEKGRVATITDVYGGALPVPKRAYILSFDAAKGEVACTAQINHGDLEIFPAG